MVYYGGIGNAKYTTLVSFNTFLTLSGGASVIYDWSSNQTDSKVPILIAYNKGDAILTAGSAINAPINIPSVVVTVNRIA